MAAEREARRRAADPEAFRAARREASRRCREEQQQPALPFTSFLKRTGGEREVLARVLRDELRRGRVEYHSAYRGYVLNGGLPANVREALLRLGLADDRRLWWELALARRDRTPRRKRRPPGLVP